MSNLVLEDGLKMLHETLCVAQSTILHSTDRRKGEHAVRIQRMLNEIERQRPLGSDGKHGKLHTPTCGCDDI